jgi:hypothetical protein
MSGRDGSHRELQGRARADAHLAVAECKKETYLGDTELQVFLRCLGDAPTCDQLVRCSGPIGSMGQAAAPPAGGAQ